MQSQSSRRQFLAGLGAAGGAAAIRPDAAFAFASGATGIRFGYTAMTWGKEERQAIDEISATGYEGVQFRIDATTEFQIMPKAEYPVAVSRVSRSAQHASRHGVAGARQAECLPHLF